MKLLLYVVVCAWLFALLDWKVIELTRLEDRDLLDWMHNHEREYALVTGTAEIILCTPALPLKPLFSEALMSVEASTEGQRAVTHAPRLNTSGFYHLPVRGQSWTFVSWMAWITYWTPPSLLWWMILKRMAK